MECRVTSEEKDLRIIKNKTKYMYSMNFKQVSYGTKRVMSVHGAVLGEMNSFKCLGSFVQKKKKSDNLMWNRFIRLSAIR